MSGAAVAVRELAIVFARPGGSLPVVDGADFTLAPGEALGLVGESGSGKTLTARALLRLLPDGARVTRGSITIDGVDLSTLSERELPAWRGRTVGFVPQEPASALDPLATAGEQVAEVLRVHRGLSVRAARSAAIAALESAGLAEPERCAAALPHELSGGMRQRVCLALAIAGRPRLVIADEPTSALDAVSAARWLDQLQETRRSLGTSLLLVSHDLGAVAAGCDRVAIFYAGRVVERGPAAEVLRAPRHPYTKALVAAQPRWPAGDRPSTRLDAIGGSVPEPGDWPSGCRFHPRCPLVRDECRGAIPPLRAEGAGREHACPVVTAEALT